jgi:hypothetical protein
MAPAEAAPRASTSFAMGRGADRRNGHITSRSSRRRREAPRR